MRIHLSSVCPHVWDTQCEVCFSPFSLPSVSLPLAVLEGHFGSQPCLLPSDPFQCGLFSTFSCLESAATLQVVFWITYTGVDIIQVYPWHEVNSVGSSYPPSSLGIPIGILIGIVLTIQMVLSSMNILTIFTVLINEHEMQKKDLKETT